MYKQEVVNRMFVDNHSDYRRSDGERIMNVLRERFNVSLSLSDAIKLWEDHSDNWAAGWLGIESDDEIADVFSLAYDSFVEKNGE